MFFFFFNITIYFELHVIISKLKSTLRQKKKKQFKSMLEVKWSNIER